MAGSYFLSALLGARRRGAAGGALEALGTTAIGGAKYTSSVKLGGAFGGGGSGTETCFATGGGEDPTGIPALELDDAFLDDVDGVPGFAPFFSGGALFLRNAPLGSGSESLDSWPPPAGPCPGCFGEGGSSGPWSAAPKNTW